MESEQHFEDTGMRLPRLSAGRWIPAFHRWVEGGAPGEAVGARRDGDRDSTLSVSAEGGSGLGRRTLRVRPR